MSLWQAVSLARRAEDPSGDRHYKSQGTALASGSVPLFLRSGTQVLVWVPRRL